jgi:hypothetical protein
VDDRGTVSRRSAPAVQAKDQQPGRAPDVRADIDIFIAAAIEAVRAQNPGAVRQTWDDRCPLGTAEAPNWSTRPLAPENTTINFLTGALDRLSWGCL